MIDFTQFNETKYASNASMDFGVTRNAVIVYPGDSNVKTAAESNSSESLHYASTQLRPCSTKTYIIVIAMGASDSYGPNRNADGFTRSMLTKYHPTFEDYASIYVNHANKDPKGSIGEIIRSFYNRSMDRVELLLALDNQKGHKFVQRIHDGRVVPVSMGLNIPGDICTICGHFAPKIKNHCKHMVRGGLFGPNTIYYIKDDRDREYPGKDGVQIYVDNPAGRFFDLSMVTRPADRIAYPIYWPSAFMGKSDAEKKIAFLVASGYDDEFIEYELKCAREDDTNQTPRFAHYAFDSATTDPAKIADMVKRIDGIASGLGTFADAPVFVNEKKAEIIANHGISSMADLLRRSGTRASFPEVYKFAHMAMYGQRPTYSDIKSASQYQADFISTIHESPALKVSMDNSLSLSEIADDRHVAYLRKTSDMPSSCTMKLADEHSSTRKQRALCGFVSASIFLQQKIGNEEIIRGKSLSSDVSTKKNIPNSGRNSVSVYENPTKLLNELSANFGDIIF